MGRWRGEPPPFFPSALCSTEERNEINRIVPRLYLTSFEGAENADELKRIKATHIVAVGREFMDNTKNQAALRPTNHSRGMPIHGHAARTQLYNDVQRGRAAVTS